MGMLKCTPALQAHQFHPCTVRWTISKELRETTKELNAEMFDSGGLQNTKERIDSLHQELRNSTDLNLQGSKSMSTKLVSEELIPGAAKHFSNSPVQIGTSNSSGWLGGTIDAPSTSSQVTSNDLPVGGIMASANPNAVGGRSKSSFMRMLRCKTMLQPHHFRPSTVCWTFKELRETIKDLNTKVFQSDVIQKAKESIASLQQELRNSTNLILQEHSKLIWIQVVQNTFLLRLERTFCVVDSGPNIISMEKTSRENDKILKDLQTGLLLNFDRTDSLLSEVEDIHKRNKDASKVASRLRSGLDDYEKRMMVESSWLCKFADTVKDFSSKLPAVTSEIDDLQKYLSELSEIVDELASTKHTTQDYDSQLCALRTIFRIWVSIDLSSKNSAFLLEAATDYCSICKNLRSIHTEKIKFSDRFLHIEKDVSQNNLKLEKTISDLRVEVDRAKKLYVKKLSSIPKDRQRFDIKSHSFQKIIGHSDFSWRFRKYYNRNITPAIRTQGRGECSSVSTVSATESLYKKQRATEITVGDNVYQADEFIIELSHNHLQDIVGQFYKMNRRKGNEKLAVCMEQMEEKGVVSESAYNKGDTKVQDFERYRISGFEELNIADFHGACAKLKEGNVLVGNFRVTTDFHRLEADDIYDIPADPVYVITPSGLVSSHCVVIVGFGVTPEGESYYVFQNSYGEGWGSGGYGRVTSSSLKYLYSPTL